MKKLLLIVVSAFTLLFSAEATHITGGDLEYEFMGLSGSNPVYKIKLRLYRDCTGFTADIPSASITATSSCFANQNITMTKIAGPLSNGNWPPASYYDCADPGTVKCVEVALFETTITLPGNCADWTFYYTNCCRPTGIDNLVGSNGLSFYFEARLNNAFQNNNSPELISTPARAFCTGNTFNWKQLINEVDGDSISFELLPARGTNANNLLPYAAPYTFAQPLPTTPPGSFVLNPATGLMSFTLGTQGTFVIPIRVNEFRFDTINGIWRPIGHIERELVVAVAGACNAVAQDSVKLDISYPQYYIDGATGRYTADYTCLDSSVVLKFTVKLDCETISPDGTDFRLTAPNGQPIPVKQLIANCDVNNETDEIIVKLHEPLAFNGDYYLYSKLGNDGNTLINKCGFPMAQFDTLQLRVNGCFQTQLDMKNVSIIDDDYPRVQWELDTVGTPSAPFPTYLVDQYKIYRSDDNGGTYNLIYTLNNYKQMFFNDQSLGYADVDAQSYKYKVDVVVNSFEVGKTRDVHSIWLRTANGQAIAAPADKVDLLWNAYNGWPSPEYTVFLGVKDANGTWVETAHVPTTATIDNPTFDTTYFMENENLAPGDYRICVRADYPGGSGPYEAWSNCLPFTIYEPPVIVEPVDTPVAIVIPNIITPNGDTRNDLFEIKNIETWKTTRSVQIFNRWGTLVYENGAYLNDIGTVWDGKDQSGKKLPDGVYFYIIEVFDQPSGKRENYNGQVTIMGTF